MKRIIVFCDGTWNKPDEADPQGKSCPTNVAKLFRATCQHDSEGVHQIAHYIRGVGTHRDDKLRGGAFGLGISNNIKDGYQFICSNYEPGDNIFLFGFSRGAYTARSLAGLIHNLGILRREHFDQIDKAYKKYRDKSDAWHPKGTESIAFRNAYTHGDQCKKIKFLGVWDTVGALGAPYGLLLGWLIDKVYKCRFHDVQLSDSIESAYHALARHEKRWPFRPSLWTLSTGHDPANFDQVWFDGVHCDVGGGYADSRLSDITLQWMAGHAVKHGMKLNLSQVFGTSNKPSCRHDSQHWYYRWTTLAMVKWPAQIFVEWPGRIFRTWPDTVYGRLNRWNIIAEPDIRSKVAYIDFDGNYNRPVTDKVLSVGEEIAVIVDPGRHFQITGLKVAAGERYEFEAKGVWADASHECGPTGWSEGWTKYVRRFARLPGYDLFYLAGNIGLDETSNFPIGAAATVDIDTPGELFLFANDLWYFYFNNRALPNAAEGPLTVSIRRIK